MPRNTRCVRALPTCSPAPLPSKIRRASKRRPPQLFLLLWPKLLPCRLDEYGLKTPLSLPIASDDLVSLIGSERHLLGRLPITKAGSSHICAARGRAPNRLLGASCNIPQPLSPIARNTTCSRRPSRMLAVGKVGRGSFFPTASRPGRGTSVLAAILSSLSGPLAAAGHAST